MLLIVIVNYRSADLVIDCLRSLAPQVAGRVDRRAVIVEGGSGDDSAQRISDAISNEGFSAWASLTVADRNGGFAYGNNLGIAPALRSDNPPQYIWLLNPDTIARPGAADALLAFMEAHPEAGIAGSRLENPDGSPQRSAFRFPGVLSQLENGLRLGIVSRLLSHRIVAPEPPTQTQQTDWVSGASFMIRRRVLEQIGLLDDRYFMYFEELDFCRRAAKAGWSCWYVPQSRIVHLVGQSSGITDRRRRMPAYWFDSRRRYYIKNHGRAYALAADLAWAGGYTLWRMRRVLQRKPDTDPPHLLRDFLRSVIRGPWSVVPNEAESLPSPSGSLPCDSGGGLGRGLVIETMASVAAVAIGRNEGDRLRRCLEALKRENCPTVYVDSGSSDGSVELARRMGVDVVELDLSTPFTAARARNAGFDRLMQIRPVVQWVQFLDGDCELCPGWLARASGALNDRPDLAAVAGQLRERHPDASVYNRLCAMEWAVPAGECDRFGGIVMLRAQALRQSGGYNPRLIAGEDPELAVRLRLVGWKILRLSDDMALHDAAMTRFGQWWKRNVRAGHAYAQGAALHGRSALRHNVRQVRSNWVYGLVLPVVALGAAWWTWGLSLLLFGLYGFLYGRILHGARRRQFDRADARLLARYTVLGKFPQALGQMKYWFNRISGRTSRIIEHKPVVTANNNVRKNASSTAVAHEK
jgi:GT2 family glycosyltransferase